MFCGLLATHEAVLLANSKRRLCPALRTSNPGEVNVRSLAVDMPETTDLTAGIMALVVQQEREAISRRTKEALAVAKARGVKLGNPNGAAALRRAGRGGQALRVAVSRNADEFAQDLAPVVEAIRTEGHTSLRSIAQELNARGMLTRRGARWQVSNVKNLVERLNG